MPRPLSVIIIEDSDEDTDLLLSELRQGDYSVTFDRVHTAEEMRQALPRHKWDIIISAYTLRAFSAPDALTTLQDSGLDIPFIVVSRTVSEATVLAAMRAGASDYLMKDNLTRLTAAIEREVREAAGRRERRRIEEQFRQVQKMDAVGRLAGGVAHDFNNLLTVITGYSDLLLDRSSVQDADRMALGEIKKAAERGGALTHQLLTFSRKQTLEPRIVNLNEVVVQLEQMLRRLIGEDIDLAAIPGQDLGQVKIDPGQLEQVIMNLVVNARDAMPGGGKLTIETSNVVLDEIYTRAFLDLKPGRFVLLQISDTGCGMDADTRSHLFEPFFTTKETGKGTGLGLATVYGIIKQSGGSITVYSEPGLGTVMRIYLPRIEGEIVQSEPKKAPVEHLSGSETILLVEDDARVRKLICEILSSRGYNVVEATRGEEAVRFSHSNAGEIHLVLTDVVMPEMSGPELFKKISAQLPKIRVLYISGYTDEAMIHHGIFKSGAAFLQKPFLPTTLARKVREVLDA